MDNHRLHRQLGLVDQEGLARMRLALSGDTDLIVATLAQIEQLGACHVAHEGEVQVSISASTRIRNSHHHWQLPPEMSHSVLPATEHQSLRSLSKYTGIKPSFHTQISWARQSFDSDAIHLHLRGSSNLFEAQPEADLHLTVWNGRAVLSSFVLELDSETCHQPTLIDGAVEVASCSVALQHVLAMAGLLRDTRVTDRWLSLSLRVDGVPPEAAVDMFDSSLGPASASLLPDGTGSLVRIRLPLETTAPDILRMVDHPCAEPWALGPDDWISLSPIGVEVSEGKVIDSELTPPSKLDQVNVVVLGVGGLGSWAAPLFAQGVDTTGLKMTLVDADDTVDAHNLNRQVLYRAKDIGGPKALMAEIRLRKMLGKEPHLAGIHTRLESNHVHLNERDQDFASISLSDLVGGEDESGIQLTEALSEMDVGLACLDNMNSRSLLNRACLNHGATFVNGGGEAFEGLVELLEPGICMVCRYGEEAAKSRERISCQEVGARPVASIVTTTAWTGAMQAAVALLALCESRGMWSGDWNRGLEFDCGRVQPRAIGRLPWIEPDCEAHL